MTHLRRLVLLATAAVALVAFTVPAMAQADLLWNTGNEKLKIHEIGPTEPVEFHFKDRFIEDGEGGSDILSLVCDRELLEAVVWNEDNVRGLAELTFGAPSCDVTYPGHSMPENCESWVWSMDEDSETGVWLFPLEPNGELVTEYVGLHFTFGPHCGSLKEQVFDVEGNIRSFFNQETLCFVFPENKELYRGYLVVHLSPWESCIDESLAYYEP